MNRILLAFLLLVGCGGCGEPATTPSGTAPSPVTVTVGDAGIAGLPIVEARSSPARMLVMQQLGQELEQPPMAPSGDAVPAPHAPAAHAAGVGTSKSGLSIDEEYALSMYAYSYPQSTPYSPSATATIVPNIWVICRDLVAGGLDGCTNTSTHTCEYCTRRLLMHDSAEVEFNDTNDTNQPECLITSCGVNPWSQQPGATPDSNVYVFYGDNPSTGGLRSMHQWWGEFFQAVTNDVQLWVNIETFSPATASCSGYGGIYTGFDHKICLNYWYQSHLNAYVMSHEFGHYVHDTYGFQAATASLREGWADQHALRWAIYMWQQGLWPTASYLMTLVNPGSGMTAQHGDVLVNGEHVASEMVSGTAGALYYPAAGCTGESNPYQCGSVLSLIYWELAWNTCQLSYGTCTVGSTLIGTGGPYLGLVGWVLANATFSHALADTNAASDVVSFLKDVDTWYSNYVTSGYLTAADYARVQTVLAHHCSGLTSHCGDGSFKLPGSPLPAAYDAKGPLFFEAENGSLSGGFTTTTLTNGASNNKYEKLTWSSSHPGTTTFSSISLAPGTYKVSISAHQSVSNGTATFSYKWDAGSWQTGVAVPYNGGAWQWLQGPTGLVVSVTGNHSIAVRVNSTGTIWVDALVLNKQ